MTRVHHARPQLAGHRSIALDQPRAAVKKKKKPYKIVLEAVTQEKKKLHSILTYASNAPTGFGFVPAGHPEFTEWCKEQCRQRNLDVHIVSAKPKNKMHADPEKLSHHVHRVGHHFPLEIVNLACSKFGYVYDETDGLRKDKSRDRTNWIAQGVEAYSSRQLLHGRPTTEKESKEHTRGAVREMFPKIPDADLDSIVNHAFEEGTNRVGNAKELSLARRVQLAVVAHIRHVYTDYDKMLKTGTWMQARQNVEHVSLAKLKEWRDESGEQSNEIEDTFREVIVLDDDDEPNDEGSSSTPDEREQSMEIVSSRATARDLQPEVYADYPRMGYRGMRHVPRRTIMVPSYSRAAPLPTDPHRLPVAQTVPGHARPYVPLPEVRPTPRGEMFKAAHDRPMEPIRPLAYHAPGKVQPPLMQEIDGQLYHLEPIREPLRSPIFPQQHDPVPRVARRPVQDGYVQPQRETGTFDRSSAHSRRPSEQDVVLPSVEQEAIDLTSPRRMIHTQRPGAMSRPSSRDYTSSQQPKRKSYPSFPDDRDGLAAYDHKRPRPLYRDDSLAPRTTMRSVHAGAPQPMDHRSQYRPPAQYSTDLTSSPHQSPVHGGALRPVLGHDFPVSGSSRLSQFPMSARPSPPREARDAYPGEPPLEYVPSSGMYERRAAPVPYRMPVRDGEYRRPVEHQRDQQFGRALYYGGHDLH